MLSPTTSQLSIYRQQLEKFAELNEEEWAIFSEHLYVRQLKKKRLFVSSFKVCGEIGFILSGSVRFFFVKDGIEISNYFSFEHELIAAYSSFLQQQVSRINIEAFEDTLLICFSHKSWQQLFADQRLAYKMEKMGRLIAEHLICCYDERVMSFIAKNPQERYMELLQTQPAMLERIPQHYLANYLGITPVSLSRIRKRISTQAGRLKKLRA